jgi:RHS repeat-associated protein
VVSLNSFVGKTLSRIVLAKFSGGTGAGSWDIQFKSIALVSSDGQVRTVYDGQKSLTWNGPYHSAPSITAEILHNGGEFNPEPTTNRYKFTGKERDSESGLDYFGARYYKSAFGRFMTPDWSASATAVPYAEFGEPQSLNLYSYVRNSPVERADKDGHEAGLCYSCGPGGTTVAPGDPNYPRSTTEDLHQDLNRYGLIPGPAGMVANGASAIWSWMSGDKRSAALSAAAAIPFERAAAPVWKLGNCARGAIIEKMLGANLPRNFPVIDKLVNGVATSIKSLDLTAKSYQNIKTLTSKIDGYVDKLASFKGASGGGGTVTAAEISSKELQLAVPPGATAAQEAAIKAATERAQKAGVTVTVTVIKK